MTSLFVLTRPYVTYSLKTVYISCGKEKEILTMSPIWVLRRSLMRVIVLWLLQYMSQKQYRMEFIHRSVMYVFSTPVTVTGLQIKTHYTWDQNRVKHEFYVNVGTILTTSSPGESSLCQWVANIFVQRTIEMLRSKYCQCDDVELLAQSVHRDQNWKV
jgi:hypothetical protein